METILVTGGAGYIGSTAVRELLNKKYHVIVIDNLSKGLRERVDKRATFYQGDITDKAILEEVFRKEKINIVMHFAAYKSVGESMHNAAKYSDNIIGTINILNAMVAHKVNSLVFSSSAAVYGITGEEPVTEDTLTAPSSYYGATKLECERIIEWYCKVHAIKCISLRYFNVIGDGGLNAEEKEPENLFPIILEVIRGKRKELLVYGNDYDTIDGTGVRDYIDVRDLVDAHIRALEYPSSAVFNLGTESGTSVLEAIRVIEEVTKKKVNYRIVERRKGDPARVVASSKKAREELGWKPRYTLKESVESVWN